MAIVTIPKKGTVIVIDPDEKKAEETRKGLEKSMKNIAVINTKCFSSNRQEIIELVRDNNYQKMFYGCSIEFFNKMVGDFNLKSEEVKHIGWNLDISKVVIFYWKKKGFEPFSPAISKREESYDQEL